MGKTLLLDYDNPTQLHWAHQGDLVHPLSRTGKWNLDLDRVRLRTVGLRKPAHDDSWDEWEGAQAETVIHAVSKAVDGEIQGDHVMLRAVIEELHQSPGLLTSLFGNDWRHGATIYFPFSHNVVAYTEIRKKIEKRRIENTNQMRNVEVSEPVRLRHRYVYGMSLGLYGPNKDRPAWFYHGFQIERASENIGMFHSLCFWFFVYNDALQPL